MKPLWDLNNKQKIMIGSSVRERNNLLYCSANATSRLRSQLVADNINHDHIIGFLYINKTEVLLLDITC